MVRVVVVCSALCGAAWGCSPIEDLHLLPPGDLTDNGGTGGSGASGQGGASTVLPPGFPSSRDPLAWPFAKDSIWNLPLGDGAEFVPAELVPPADGIITVMRSIIILRPEAPLSGVHRNDAGWTGADRCPAEGELLYEVPIPADFVVPHSQEANSLAALLPDGRTIKQGQPFTRCDAGGEATLSATYPDSDLLGAGIEGAHGGSGMSSLGGTLRVGELRPGSGPVRHALKVGLDAPNLVDCDVAEQCFRWPAVKADAGAPEDYQGTNPELRMGALLALPLDMSIDELALETIPGRRIAEAFATYGGYVVNRAPGSRYSLGVERGPAGDFTAQFEQDWSMPFADADDTPWTRDILRIFAALSVVANNGPDSIGGGGLRVAPLAPDFE